MSKVWEVSENIAVWVCELCCGLRIYCGMGKVALMCDIIKGNELDVKNIDFELKD